MWDDLEENVFLEAWRDSLPGVLGMAPEQVAKHVLPLHAYQYSGSVTVQFSLVVDWAISTPTSMSVELPPAGDPTHDELVEQFLAKYTGGFVPIPGEVASVAKVLAAAQSCWPAAEFDPCSILARHDSFLGPASFAMSLIFSDEDPEWASHWDWSGSGATPAERRRYECETCLGIEIRLADAVVTYCDEYQCAGCYREPYEE